MTFKINDTDYSAYVTKRYAVALVPEVESAGETLDGLRHEAKLRDRITLTATLRPNTGANLALLSAALSARFVSVTFDNPFTGTADTRTMSHGGLSAATGIEYNGTTVYDVGKIIFEER